ncbi:MAG: hypothetical protein Q9207_004919 [Kuettlingeria erythrocarpa]
MAAHSATIQLRSGDVKRRLARESFEKILSILQQISLHEGSPKLFVIYAHDNKSTGFEAYQETVKDYISWFKRIRFNVDSDKSPHGYGVAHEIGHRGASTDIFTNQVCLLPRTWHEQNVDYVLVFYSKVLASYMKYEREFKIDDATYSDAIWKTCEKIQDSFHERSQEQWTSACDKVRTVQQRFSQAMKDSFHHVLTETALLSFTNRNRQLDKTIPIIISDDEDWEPELKWQPHFVHNQDTKLRITIKPNEDYRQFFKILLEFETLESNRPAIDLMTECFQDSVELLEKDPQPEEYRSHLEVLIATAMQKLNRQWQKIERPITRADIRSRLALYSKLDVASIQRISGERFVGDIKDIDLAVIEGPDDKERENRQNVSLHNLFDEREIKHKIIRPKQILIQGKPGIGKTTLCRRLMYEYLWNKDLRTKFDLVVRIPVRKLERSFDMRSLFFEEYFEDAPNGHKLSEVLEDLVLAHETVDSENEITADRKILLILDGLDEIMRFSHGRHALLERLMKGRAVIITSRFHDIKMPNATIDLHLEALGLSIANVDAYIDNNMFIAEDSARQIRQFIEASALVKDMIRVPIHLDIVCYGWNELHGHDNAFKAIMEEEETSTPTMATLYQSVVRSLWRQDVPSLGKMDHGELMTAETVNAVHDIARLDRLVNTENDLLEELAINMLVSDRIEFTNQDVANVIQHWESNGDQIPLSLESRIHKLSLLRSSSREGYRTFCFVHLTFQDFFAARYIIRSLVQGPSRLKSILGQHKYNRHYELFWRFIPGLLTKAEDLDFFFQLLDEEPRDLLGIQHIRLLMHCWHEWPVRLKSRRWEELVKRLEDWQELECRLGVWDGIGSSTVFPENILTRKLELGISETVEIDEGVLYTICGRTSLSEDFIRCIIQLIVNHELYHQYIRALEMPLSRGFMNAMQKEPTNLYFLKQVGRNLTLPASSISFLMHEVRENTGQTSSGLPYNATEILINQHTLPDKVVEVLEEWYMSEEQPLSRIANTVLEAHSHHVILSKKTVDHAVEQWISKSVDHGLDWDYMWVLTRKDLPHETVARVLAWLLQKGRTVSRFNYPVVSLHPDDVDKMGMLLEMCLRHDQVQEKDFDSLWYNSVPQIMNDPEVRVPPIEIERMTRFALFFLGLQPSLPTRILKTLVRILDWDLNQLDSSCDNDFFGPDYKIRDQARSILQGQPELHDDVLVELRDMFNTSRKEEFVAAWRGHLQLFDEAYRWALATATDCLTPQAMETWHGPEDLAQILRVLSDEPNLPEDFVDRLVYSFPRMLEDEIANIDMAVMLIRQQRDLSKDAVNCLVKILKNTDRWLPRLHQVIPDLYNRQVFAEPLVDALCKASNEEQVENLVYALDLQDSFDQTSLQRLRECLHSAMIFQSPWVSGLYQILARQAQLDKESILALNNVLVEEAISFSEFWYNRHLEQFVTSLESFKPQILVEILKVLLERSAEDITPVYINGNTLHYQAADGKMKKLLLDDEQSFRKRFREAQHLVGLPPWACIDHLPKERKLKIPVANWVKPKDRKSKIPVASWAKTSKYRRVK